MRLTEFEVLTEARELISDHNHWCKGYDRKRNYYGMDHLGNYVNHSDPEAVRWGILGAVMHVLESYYGVLYSDDDLWFSLVSVLKRTANTYGFGCSIGYNDASDHGGVLKFFDKAIGYATS